MVGMSTLCKLTAHLYHHTQSLRMAGDLPTLKHLYHPSASRQILNIRFRDNRFRVQVRSTSIDTQLIRQILCEDSEYRLPVPLQPQVIFDIGANIGITALYYATVYPQARIYCFEPLPENIELLRFNTAALADRITIIPTGLGQRNGTFPFHPSGDPANLGGGSYHMAGNNPNPTIHLPVTTVGEICQKLGIKQVDLFKIDTEGAELDILKGIPQPLLDRASALIGELHGIGDFDFLQRLSASHDMGISKRYDRNCYPFVAVRKKAKDATIHLADAG